MTNIESVFRRESGLWAKKVAFQFVDGVWKIVSENSGNYDDVWPIKWTTASVAGNTMVNGNDELFVKVSNYIPSIEELIGSTITGTVDGERHVLNYYTHSRISESIIIVLYNEYETDEYGSIVIKTETAEIDGVFIPESGIYVPYNETNTVECSLGLGSYSSEKLPIVWNTYGIQNYPVQVSDITEGLPAIKVSNLILSEVDMSAGVLTAIHNDGTKIPYIMMGTQKFDIGSLMVFETEVKLPSGTTQTNIMMMLSVTSTDASTDAEGLTFPETGLYVLNSLDWDDMGDIEFIFTSTGEPSRVFFDELPIDFYLSVANIGEINSIEAVPLLTEDGASAGSMWKISNMTPSLEELTSKYNTTFTAITLDGEIVEIPTLSTITAAWDSTGSFVKIDTLGLWVVYEAQTIHTTPFDINTPVTVDVTPGIYMTDGCSFFVAFALAILSTESKNGTYVDDSVRIFLGTAEDAAKAIAEYGI